MTTCKQCHNYGHHQMDCRSKCWVCNNTGHIGNNCAMNNNSSNRTPPPVQQRVNPPAQTRHGHVAISSSIGYNANGQLVRRTAYAPTQQYVNLNQPQFHVPQPMVFQGSGTNPQVFGFHF
jgi:hypothetical protein